MITGRDLPRLTLLSDGRVLISGRETYDKSSGQHSATSTAELYASTVLVSAPELFSTSGDGKGQGAVWNAQTGRIASADNPAVAGEALSMYTTSLASNGVIPPQVALNGRLAEVLCFGDAPGYPGYYQVNFLVPSGVAPGTAVAV